MRCSSHRSARPRSPRLARILTRCGWSDEPLEAQRVWDYLWRGDDDVMLAGDAEREVARWYRDRVRRTLALRGATRFQIGRAHV